MVISQLTKASEPWLLLLEGSPDQAYELAWRTASEPGAVARVLRGKKMQTVKRLFDEFGAALQFPSYFGENWAALDECLADLSWLPAHLYALCVTDAAVVLKAEPTEMIGLLAALFAKAGTSWATPVQRSEPWDRGPIPFHVILQASSAEVAQVLQGWGPSAVALLAADR